jgi:hypothetical protein
MSDAITPPAVPQSQTTSTPEPSPAVPEVPPTVPVDAAQTAEPTVPVPDRERTWAVHRQDDNGNRFVVQTGLTPDEAERFVVQFEAKGHKQVYWAEPE